MVGEPVEGISATFEGRARFELRSPSADVLSVETSVLSPIAIADPGTSGVLATHSTSHRQPQRGAKSDPVVSAPDGEGHAFGVPLEACVEVFVPGH